MSRRRGTGPGDLVLIHFQGRPASFARVEEIRPQGRPGWFLCDLLVLTIPPQPATWILDREQIDGADFTMGEQPVRLERVAEIGVLHAEQRAAERRSEPPTPKPPAKGAGAGDAATPAAVEGRAENEEAAKTAARRDEKVVHLFPKKR